MKKRLLIINTVIGECSTGKIVANIADEHDAKGYEVKIAYGRDSCNKELVEKYGVRIGNNPDFYLHALYTRLTDNHGLGSKNATVRFLKWAEEYNPDILWLHNIHGYYINYELLFEWIKQRPFMEVKWTLHDCWAFTGHCAFFTFAKCDKWKRGGCGNCPQIDQYPMSLVDNSAMNYMRKRAAFTGVSDMTLITPSKWLKETAEDSFLLGYNIEVVNNTINEEVFKPTLIPKTNSFKTKYGLQNKIMILGVANVWERRKGLQDFIRLAIILNHAKYQIVLVGVSRKQKKLLDKTTNIISMERTESVEELARLYAEADVFVNPTYEDNYPTVNLEAERCGTPVICYDTGGCKETISRPDSCVIEKGVNQIVKELKKRFESKDKVYSYAKKKDKQKDQKWGLV